MLQLFAVGQILFFNRAISQVSFIVFEKIRIIKYYIWLVRNVHQTFYSNSIQTPIQQVYFDYVADNLKRPTFVSDFICVPSPVEEAFQSSMYYVVRIWEYDAT